MTERVPMTADYQQGGERMLDPRREGKLTGTRMAPLITGDPEKIMRLYRIFLGEEQEEDLSRVWPVQLGATTEQLNLNWYVLRKNSLSRRGEFIIHPQHDWAAATIDGWDDILGCPVECKHTGGREPFDIIVDRYQPQIQWQMECTAASQCALSVIMGASEPIVEYLERDADYAAEMVKRGQQFMRCVELRTPPVILPAVPAPIIATKTYDLSTNNAWVSSAFAWLEGKPHADKCKDAEKILKSLVPEDAKKCFGAGVVITKDRANRMYLREETS